MRDGKYLKILFCLMIASIFLPWFTCDADIVGYCWGGGFLSVFSLRSKLRLFAVGPGSKNNIKNRRTNINYSTELF